MNRNRHISLKHYRKTVMAEHDIRYLCQLPDGQFVGNLISSPVVGGAIRRSFVPVQKKDACRFFTKDAAEKLASDHGAKDFTVIEAQ